MTFKLIVEGFRDGGTIPRLHSCDGQDLSPRLTWENTPVMTKSFALIVDDPDAPMGTWNHWLLWDISADMLQLAEGYQPGSVGVDGNSDFGRLGYGGPCPPRGHGEHRYFFKLHALDVVSLGLQEGAGRRELDAALRDHVLAEAQYMGRYERK